MSSVVREQRILRNAVRKTQCGNNEAVAARETYKDADGERERQHEQFEREDVAV